MRSDPSKLAPGINRAVIKQAINWQANYVKEQKDIVTKTNDIPDIYAHFMTICSVAKR